MSSSAMALFLDSRRVVVARGLLSRAKLKLSAVTLPTVIDIFFEQKISFLR